MKDVRIIGEDLAKSVFQQRSPRKGASEDARLGRMLAKKERMPAAIALTNKMAHGVWAMLTKSEDYRKAAMA